MRKHLIWVVVFIFGLANMMGLSADGKREKTEKIGKLSWYTEQNTFEEMLQFAKKANKPIMAVFSATWCGPCQQVKKAVFASDDFKKAADEALLLYIEQTTKEGMAYVKKYKIEAYPTFKIFSKEGIMLDTGHPERSVDGFLEWIKEVKAGNNFYELSKRLEKNPNDRDALVKIVDRLDWSQRKEKIDYLKQAIQLKPDFNDPLAQEAYEKLAGQLINNIPYREGEEKTAYLNDNRKMILDILDAYYPDKFKHGLKGNFGLSSIIYWFNQDKKFDKAHSIFKDFLKLKGGNPDLVKDLDIISRAVSTFVGMGKIEEADKWLTRVKNNAAKKDTETLKKDRAFFYYYSNIFWEIIDYFGKKEKVTEAEKYAGLYSQEMERLGQGRMKEYVMQRYAAEYGLFARKTLESLEEKIKTGKGPRLSQLITTAAKILVKMGKKEEARKRLLQLYENKEFFESLKDKNIPGILNEIAWTMVELKMVDQKSLEIAQKAVSLSSSPMIMDTLACVHAELGNLKEAIKIEKEAVEKTKDDYDKKDFMAKIKKWEKRKSDR